MLNNIEIYHYLWFFIMYAIIGWGVEVIYAVVTTGQFVNRGFLNGPLCPIYGFGVITIMLCLTPFADNLLLLFIGSVLLTSLLEGVTGFVLEKAFQSKWWDYSDKPFNIGGYVCLSFSLMWGLGCIFIIKQIQPLVMQFVFWIPPIMGIIILIIALLLLMADFIVTVKSVMGLNKHLDQLEKVAEGLNYLSNEMGESISKNTLAIMEKNEEIKSKFEEKRPEIEALLEKQHELLSEKKFAYRRLIRAFPTRRSNRFTKSLEWIKEEVANRKIK
jgi:uncharacterized membrane protein